MKLFERLKKLTKKKEEKVAEVSAPDLKFEKAPVWLPPTISTAADLLLRAVVSEKGAKAETGGTYTFVIRKDANKIQVKQALKERYGVAPSKVRIINLEGKRLRWGQVSGKRPDWKKAVVTLPKGKTISIHEGV